MSKERDAFVGERNPSSKMNKRKVLKARLLKDKGLSYNSISKIFKVGISTIVDIIQNRTWRHI
jgi:transposase